MNTNNKKITKEAVNFNSCHILQHPLECRNDHIFLTDMYQGQYCILKQGVKYTRNSGNMFSDKVSSAEAHGRGKLDFTVNNQMCKA